MHATCQACSYFPVVASGVPAVPPGPPVTRARFFVVIGMLAPDAGGAADSDT